MGCMFSTIYVIHIQLRNPYNICTDLYILLKPLALPNKCKVKATVLCEVLITIFILIRRYL